MSGHGDLQELLRIFTSRRVPMMAAMKHVQALQLKSLKSIDQIAASPVADVEAALGDSKLAKSVHAACKAHGKKATTAAGTKRSGDGGVGASSSAPPGKQPRLDVHKRDLNYEAMSPDELEEALALPVSDDEASMRVTTVLTNRAPLLLAFAVELMRFTMPEQPPSSRLSLAQAVVSANSRSKAVSLGIEKTTGPAVAGSDLSEGQPRVRVMGREVPVLKRGGYTWSGAPARLQQQQEQPQPQPQTPAAPTWKASRKVESRMSTFVAHAVPVTSAGTRPELVRGLMAQKPELTGASHNVWAVRSRYGASPLVQEASSDDGETGAGRFLLEVMREADVSNALVVLTRWYGGVMLGQDRWRIMRECVNDALAAQSRRAAPALSGEPVWALDVAPSGSAPAPATNVVGMAIHRPEAARNYLLRSFASAAAPDEDEDKKKKHMTVAAANDEKHDNLARLLGALRLLFASWASTLGPVDLDRRAWSWYMTIRPDVDAGPAGWGAKGTLNLGRILDLRKPGEKKRNEEVPEQRAEGEKQDDGGPDEGESVEQKA